MALTITKKIINSWIIKGELEKDVFNKYICFWISFNAIYASRYSVEGDRSCIKEVKKDSYYNNEYKLLLKESDFKNKIDVLYKLCPITDEKNGDIYSFNVNDFPALIEILYQVRNNLFHGAKNTNDERDLKVVSAAYPILKELLNKFEKYS